MCAADVIVLDAPARSESSLSFISKVDSQENVCTPDRAITAPEQITIYGYPDDVFPPTDFHTFTYFCDPGSGKESIFIIRGLSYHKASSRDQTETEVYKLSISDFSIRRLKTNGAKPPERTYGFKAELIDSPGSPEPAIKVTTKEGKDFSLLLNKLEWISHG